MNIYSEIVRSNINKLLNLYNLDPFSKTFGFGDRTYWAWKTIDFPNATFQGGVHALSNALTLNLVDNHEFIINIIDNVICASKKIILKNGSVSEAFPNENSFCVTALMAFDMLSTIQNLEEKISENKKKKYLQIISPLINFISKNNEEHAIISNHLATGAAAIALWNKLSNDSNNRDKELLDIIFSHQSCEGWYKEYEGADPGYQTLCTYYLASAYENTEYNELKESLIRSGKFLANFIHPDHTIGGVYGSRNTEIYYPGGVVALSNISDEFNLIANHLQKGIESGKNLMPIYIDANNYIPLINSYAVAAKNSKKIKDPVIKTFYSSEKEKIYESAGLHLKSTKKYFSITNFKKSGAIKVFDLRTNKIDSEEGGIFGITKSGIKFSTQQFDQTQKFKKYEINAKFYKINDSYPSTIQFIIIRLMALTIFKSTKLGNLFKKALVKMLMTGKKVIDGGAEIKFDFKNNNILINDNLNEPKNTKIIGRFGKTKAIHMASSGYFTEQLKEKPLKSNIIIWE